MKRPGGAFANYMQCREHKAPPAELSSRCLSCQFVEQHNWEIYLEIAAEKGWLVDEPAGDVPMGKMAESRRTLSS